MSYLRGPLSREQIRTLDRRRPSRQRRRGQVTGRHAKPRNRRRTTENPRPRRTPETRRGSAPVLAPGVQQYFLPPALPNPHYMPVALGIARVTFTDAKLKINETRDVVAVAPIGERRGAGGLGAGGDPRPRAVRVSRRRRPADATFDPLPKPAAAAKNYAAWQKSFAAVARGLADARPAAPCGSEADARRPESRSATSASACRARSARRATPRSTPSGGKFARQARAGGGEAAQGRAGRVARAGTGVRREGADGGLDGRDGARRAVRPQDLQREHPRPRDHRGPRRRPRLQGAGRREAGAGERATSRARRSRSSTRQIEEETAAIAARYDAAASALDTVSLAPKRGQVLVQSVALGWKPADS